MIYPNSLPSCMCHQKRRARRLDDCDPNLTGFRIIRILYDLGERISVQAFGTAIASFEDSPHDARRLALQLLQTVERTHSELWTKRILDLDGSLVNGLPGKLGGPPPGVTQFR